MNAGPDGVEPGWTTSEGQAFGATAAAFLLALFALLGDFGVHLDPQARVDAIKFVVVSLPLLTAAYGALRTWRKNVATKVGPPPATIDVYHGSGGPFLEPAPTAPAPSQAGV